MHFSTGFVHNIGGLSDVPADVTNMPSPPGALNKNSSYKKAGLLKVVT